VASIDAVHDQHWGTMVALQAGEIVPVSLAEAVGTLKTVDPDLYDVARVFFAG
jgi:6-phosphofructokinase 1